MNIQGDQILELIKGLWSFVPKEYMILIYLVGTVFAFLNCFMGYRLRKVWGCILGIFMGGGVGFGAGLYFLQDDGRTCGGSRRFDFRPSGMAFI